MNLIHDYVQAEMSSNFITTPQIILDIGYVNDCMVVQVWSVSTMKVDVEME